MRLEQFAIQHTEMRHSLRPDKRVAIWIADFCMCWLALCGVTNIVAGVASFRFKIGLSLSDEPITTPAQKLIWIGLCSLMSGIGFTYMLWRHNWHCRLSTLLKIPLLWCAAFAAFAATQLGGAGGIFGILGLAFFVFVYSVSWASRAKGDPSHMTKSRK